MCSLIKRAIAGLALLTTMCVSGAASAEPFGLLNGRSANISRAPDQSIEAGAIFGEFDDVDYTYFGGRYNYKLNPVAVIYGDVGQSSFEIGDDADGVTFGIGGFYQIDGVFASADFAVHASLHLFDLDLDNSDLSLEGNSIVVEGLFSGKNAINQAGTLFFNGSIGLSRLDSEIGNNDDTDTELTFSAGLVLETQGKGGEFYGGLVFIDDLSFGGGYRYFLK